MIDPLFRNMNRLFVLSFKNGSNDHTRDSFDKYQIPLVENKDFNALNNNKPFFDEPIKNKQEAFGKHVEMSRKDDYTIGNLSDYLYHQKYYKLIGIDLSSQKMLAFLNKLVLYDDDADDDAATFFITEKRQRNQSKLFLRFINCDRII